MTETSKRSDGEYQLNFSQIENYQWLHRETHRRVYPWLYAPLIARQIGMVPSWSGLKASSGTGVNNAEIAKKFMELVRYHDPFFEAELPKQPEGDDDPKYLFKTTASRWSFGGSDQESAVTPNAPLNLQLPSPYVHWPVALPFDTKGNFVEPSRETAREDCLRCILRADVFAEHMTLTQIFELSLNERLFEFLGLDESQVDLAKSILGVNLNIDSALEMDFERGSDEQEELKRLKTHLTHTVWGKYDEFVAKRAGLKSNPAQEPKGAVEKAGSARNAANDHNEEALTNCVAGNDAGQSNLTGEKGISADGNAAVTAANVFSSFNIYCDFRLIMPRYPGIEYPQLENLDQHPQIKRKLLETDRLAAYRVANPLVSTRKRRAKKPNQQFSPASPPWNESTNKSLIQVRDTCVFRDDDGSASRALGQYWPLWASEEHKDGNSEIVANTFLDGSALYVSTLGFEAVLDSQGNPPPGVNEASETGSGSFGTHPVGKDSGGKPHRPLKLLLVSAMADPWQASRLVFRLFFLGNARLLAVRQISEMYMAEQSLEELDSEIKSEMARDDWVFLPLYNNAAVIALGFFKIIADLLFLQKLKDFVLARRQKYQYRTNFAKTYDRILKYGDPNVSGERLKKGLVKGLEHRISRSIYHSNAYRARIEDLREGTLLGYQSYSELMRRRIFATFDRLQRMDRLNRQVRQSLADYVDRQRQKTLVVIQWFVVSATIVGLVLAFSTSEFFQAGQDHCAPTCEATR